MCGALPNGLDLQEINIAQLNVISNETKQLLEIIACRKDQSFPGIDVLKLTSIILRTLD